MLSGAADSRSIDPRWLSGYGSDLPQQSANPLQVYPVCETPEGEFLMHLIYVKLCFDFMAPRFFFHIYIYYNYREENIIVSSLYTYKIIKCIFVIFVNSFLREHSLTETYVSYSMKGGWG